LFLAARWLRDVPDNALWRAGVMRQVAAVLQKENQSMGHRARALIAVVGSNEIGIAAMLRQMLSQESGKARQLAALGCGLLRDTKAVPEITKLLAHLSPPVRNSACLALIAIGDKVGLEAVATALLRGDEGLRKTAAEALANDPEEGYPALQEGSQLEDLHVRRAVVSGLARIDEPWAVELLKKISLEDSQWVVQNAASQALEELARPNPRIPRRLPALPQTPWLISFAGQFGIGVVPGKPALDLVYRAVKEGSEEQQLAALHFITYKGDENAVLPVYQAYFGCTGEIQDAALNALWHLHAASLPMPSPEQYGFPA
jgi:HEAT repeat protein